MNAIEYECTIDGSDYTMTIDYRMGWVSDGTETPAWGVEGWSISHIDGKPNILAAFWPEQLNDVLVCDAIMETETA